MTAPFLVSADGQGVVIRVKAVPGARTSEIAGVLGDRLKVRVAAPAEGGRANEAIVRLLADSLGVPARTVTLVTGHGNPEKHFRLHGLTEDALDRLLPR